MTDIMMPFKSNLNLLEIQRVSSRAGKLLNRFALKARSREKKQGAVFESNLFQQLENAGLVGKIFCAQQSNSSSGFYAKYSKPHIIELSLRSTLTLILQGMALISYHKVQNWKRPSGAISRFAYLLESAKHVVLSVAHVT